MIYIIYSEYVCFIQMRLFMCMHAQEVLFSNKTYKKPVMFFKNDRKKLFSLQNVIKKLCETHYS